jgi:hypothetical protein
VDLAGRETKNGYAGKDQMVDNNLPDQITTISHEMEVSTHSQWLTISMEAHG